MIPTNLTTAVLSREAHLCILFQYHTKGTAIYSAAVQHGYLYFMQIILIIR